MGRVDTGAGPIGLGETFYCAGAVEVDVSDTLTGRLLGQDPLLIECLHLEMLNMPMAQARTGVETRAASAIDAALWDFWVTSPGSLLAGHHGHEDLALRPGRHRPSRADITAAELNAALFPFSQTRAAVADTCHRPSAPHGCIGPVGFVAAVYATFSPPNTLVQENVRAA